MEISADKGSRVSLLFWLVRVKVVREPSRLQAMIVWPRVDMETTREEPPAVVACAHDFETVTETAFQNTAVCM